MWDTLIVPLSQWFQLFQTHMGFLSLQRFLKILTYYIPAAYCFSLKVCTHLDNLIENAVLTKGLCVTMHTGKCIQSLYVTLWIGLRFRHERKGIPNLTNLSEVTASKILSSSTSYSNKMGHRCPKLSWNVTKYYHCRDTNHIWSTSSEEQIWVVPRNNPEQIKSNIKSECSPIN